MLRINKLSLHRLNEIAASRQAIAFENRIYQSGELLFDEDTSAKGVYYLERGTVLLSSTKQTGTDVVINIIGPNNFIGYLPLIQKTKYNSSAIVLQDNCRIRFISKALFQEALTDIRFANGFIKILCELIKSNEKQAVYIKTKGVRESLATVLVSLETTFKKSAKDSSTLITLKKKDLASLIGVAPETLSRSLAGLEKEGLIELHFKGIKVMNKEKLLHIADGIV